MTLVETADDARAVTVTDPDNLSFLTQTTLSVDDTAEIIAILTERFPTIRAPKGEDICYATTNRQAAVKAIAPGIDCLLVVGAPNSSNSLRLVEVAERAGCARAFLIQRASAIPWEEVGTVRTLGITAGASAPEVLVNEVIEAFRERYSVAVETVTTARESIAFNVPRELREQPGA
jgi:4-hydroxy-3-methylbut-2-enyl diphosphate reductase